MKRWIRGTTLLLALLLALPTAARSQVVYSWGKDPIYATLNQKMATRMGPSNAYVGMPTYSVDTEIVVFEQVMGSGVPWALVEFNYKGGKYRLYTGMKRIDVYETVPWGNTEWFAAWTTSDCYAYFGPGEDYVRYDERVPWNTYLQVYDIENDFLMCDYTQDGKLHRLYIPMADTDWDGDGSSEYEPPYWGGEKELIYATLNQRMATRMGPGTAYVGMPTYSVDTDIRVIEQVMGGSVPWALVEFTYKGGKYRLYTGMKRIDAYDTVPWGSTEWEAARTTRACYAYYGPGEEYVRYDKRVPKNMYLKVFDTENGFLMCDYTQDDKLHRLYIPMEDTDW